jgi:phosphopantetheinyl transferase
VAAGLDEPGLRAWARTEAAGVAASHASRSYCYPYALVAWHTEPVGVDIERIEPLEQAFTESICTPSERRMLTGDEHPDVFPSALWSSKEALAKALGDARRYDPRRLDSPAFWLQGQAGPWRAALLPVPARHSAWLCWRSSAARY